MCDQITGEYSITEKELDELIYVLEWAEYAATNIDIRASARHLGKIFRENFKERK